MKVYDATAIRNIALVGHTSSGKTQLASAMLSVAGMVNRFGKVDEGTTVTDYDDEEIARRHTLGASLAFAEWNKQKINIIDTPGIGNFLSDARAALHVADAAVVVVDAVSGVMVQTEKVWEAANELNLPRLVALNRLDRERANLDRALQSLRDACSRAVVPIQLPIGDERSFRGVVDLITRKAYVFESNESGKFKEDAVPSDMTARVDAAREALVEMVAEADDKLMDRFFEAGTLSDEELVAGLKSGTAAAKLYPLVCVSALANVGVPQLLDAIVNNVPSPAERPYPALDKSKQPITCAADDKKAPQAFVWKTIADPFAGRITMFRVVSGTIKSDSTLLNKTRDSQERLGHVMLLQGKTQTSVPEVKAGDLAAVAKLKDTLTNDTLGDKSDGVIFPAVTFPEPVLSYAIEPKSRGDEDKISGSMHRLEEEDPSIKYSRDPQTKELLLSGQGQLHIEVTVAKLKRRFGVDVNLKPPRIPYRETIKGATEAHGRHKKQTGGHGQFGDCKIRMKPLPRGSDFKFVDDIFGGSIPKNFIPAVEKGIQEARLKGFLAGYPMVDFQVELYDGQYHDVDSSEMSFKIAGSLAFKDAVAKCRPTILEPIMKVEITVPEEYAGSVMGDLSSRRGRPQGMEPTGSLQVIKAEVPLAEMLSYDAELTSMTGGRGSYHMEMGHYDEVPGHLQDKIVAAARAERGDVKEEE